MILGINPKVDYAFKYMLGRDVSRPILVNVLDSVLDAGPGHRVGEVDLMNPFNAKEALDDKLSILDIKARDESGRQFNVEMQMLAYPHYEKRILYYAARLHQQQLHEGQDYVELKPTISISFLDHIMFPGVSEYHLRFRLREESRNFSLTDDLVFHILELPKFTKSATELTSDLDIWLYFLRHAEMMDLSALPPVIQAHPLALRALEGLKMLTQTDLERERYESRLKAQLDHNTIVRVARLEGREEGRQEGQQKGRDEGVYIGNINVYERLLNQPVTPKEQLSRLSLHELARLAEELQARIPQLR